MWTKEFWKAAAERAVKSVVQAQVGLVLAGDKAFDVFSVDWSGAAGVGLGAALLSIATSLASAKLGPKDSPSVVADPAAAHA